MRFKCILPIIFAVAGLAYGQSLGDVAREQRQKQQTKPAQAPAKVITDDDMPKDGAGVSTVGTGSSTDPAPSQPVGSKSAEQWKAEIAAQKKAVDNLQSQMDQLNSSIRFAPGNCVRNCVQWNEHQVEKQNQVQRMQGQLDEQKKRLEEMQDGARKDGYGNSVYEP